MKIENLNELSDKWVFDSKTLSSILKKIRKEKRLTATNICRQIGISRDTLNRLEKGEDVTSSTIFKVLEALELYMVLSQARIPTLEQASSFFLTELNTTNDH